MYTEKIFEVKARKDIYNFIKKNPGVHFRKISRSLNVPPSTLSYHLSYLIKRELLTKESKNSYLRFYVSQKIGKNDKKLFNILREEVPRNIVLYLFLYVESSKKEMVEFAERWKNHPSKIGYHLNKHRTTLEFHLKKLLEEGIIESFNVINNGSEYLYRLKNSEEIYDLIIRYEKSILADAYGRFLKWIDDSNNKDKTDKVVNMFFDIFPIPYRS